jgi:hypothetical protein
LLNPYKPLVTYDNIEEIKKIKKYCPNAGLVLRIRVPSTGRWWNYHQNLEHILEMRWI